MTDYQALLADLKTRRDELKLQMHLATREARDEFEKLEAQWEEFAAKAKLHESAEGLGEALESVGTELKKSYERLRKAL